jgi:two-component system phosphate regulon sensor histidine kinase PhoR
MFKQNTSVITILASISILALIGVQLFWINNAVELREEEFRGSINEALNSVVEKLDKTSAAAKIKKNIRLRKQGIRTYPADYSIKKVLTSDTMKNKVNDIFEKDKVNVKVFEELTTDSNGVVTTTYNKYEGDTMEASGILGPLSSDELQGTNDVEKLKLELIQQRTEMVHDLFEELVSINIYKNYKPQIDTVLLDSLLKSELLYKGINSNYIYRISIDETRNINDFIHSVHECDTTGCYFKINLAPNNAFIKPTFLSVYFPKHKTYIYKTLWIMLTVSGVIIIILTFSFYYTITTIQKQKKLSLIKNDFISNMTHEFKTPISTISLASEFLNDDSVMKTPEKVGRYVKMIKDENKRLSVLVESILQTAILDKGDFKLKITEIDLHEIINQAIQNIQLQVEQRKGTIIPKFFATNPKIFADKVHITNIVFNLMDNAIKYSKEVPEITITTDNRIDGIVFSVKDAGVGITKDNLKKVFDQFYRIPTGNVHNIKGFGLGLSYVRAIVIKHGGDISVESEINKGSTFRVFLPYKQEE